MNSPFGPFCKPAKLRLDNFLLWEELSQQSLWTLLCDFSSMSSHWPVMESFLKFTSYSIWTLKEWYGGGINKDITHTGILCQWLPVLLSYITVAHNSLLHAIQPVLYNTKLNSPHKIWQPNEVQNSQRLYRYFSGFVATTVDTLSKAK